MESRDPLFDLSIEDQALTLLHRDMLRESARPPQPLEGRPPTGLLPGSSRAELIDWDEPEYPRRRADEDDDEQDDFTHD